MARGLAPTSMTRRQVGQVVLGGVGGSQGPGGRRNRRPAGGRTPGRRPAAAPGSARVRGSAADVGGSTLIRSRISNSSSASRQRHVDLHQEPVPLRLRQRVDALGLDRVLGGDDDERRGQRERLAADRHLPLGHQLEHRRLHLGRRPVDLVGQHEVDEDRAELDVERLLARPVDPGADDVGRHQVGRELDPGEVAADHRRERPHGERLGHAGYALEQAVAARQQGDHQALDHVLLADDHPLDLGKRLAHKRRLGSGPVAGRRRMVAGLRGMSGRWVGVGWGELASVRRRHVAVPPQVRGRRIVGHATKRAITRCAPPFPGAATAFIRH